MGILGDIWGGIKKVVGGIFDGIKKIFKPILEPIAKFLGSSFGKALMIGLSVFTLGASLLAGAGTFMQTAGSFIDKFVAGGKTFLNTLLGTGGQGGGKVPNAPGVKGGLPGVGEARIPGQEMPGNILTGEGAAGGLQTPPAIGDTAVAQAATSPGGITGNLTGGMSTPAAAAPAAESGGNWLSKAAGAAWDFAKTEGGSNIIGSMIEGVGKGMAAKNQQEFDSRVERMFANPNDPGMQALSNVDYNIPAPQGLAPKTGEAFSNTMARIRGARNFAPTVQYTPQPGG
jgi:hypothetical protein